MKIEIEEGIYSIVDRLPIRKVILDYEESKITRTIFQDGKTTLDISKTLSVSISDIRKLSHLELSNLLKKRLEECVDLQFNAEIGFFKSPIITKTI